MNDSQYAASYFKTRLKKHLRDLSDLVRIPGSAYPGFDPSDLLRCADAVALLLKTSGFENVQLLRGESPIPYVYADHLHAPDKPTVLIYAHYDVQPVGDLKAWISPPFEVSKRKGPGGDRLYARGVADDKSGIILAAAAVSSYLDTVKHLPVNVKVIIEGEEETGNLELENFLRKHKELLQADAIYIVDSGSYDIGIPGLTFSFRGLLSWEVEMRGSHKTLHSGLFGGLVPDAATELAKLLAGVVDEHGHITIKAITDLIPPLSKKESELVKNVPFDEKAFREQAGIFPSYALPSFLSSPNEHVWFYPSYIINAFQSSSREQARGSINDTAWARVGIRLSPGMPFEKVAPIFEDYLKKNTPQGLELSLKTIDSNNGWVMDPSRPEFQKTCLAASVALKKAYKKDAVWMGCGAIVCITRIFENVFGKVPQLVTGVEDPVSNAHGDNESLLINDLVKATAGLIYFFEEFSR